MILDKLLIKFEIIDTPIGLTFDRDDYVGGGAQIYINNELKLTTASYDACTSYDPYPYYLEAYAGDILKVVIGGTGKTIGIYDENDNRLYYASGSTEAKETIFTIPDNVKSLKILMFGGYCCVPYWSLLQIDDNTFIKVEDVSIGDKILAYDFVNNIPIYTKVLGISKPLRDHLVKITLEDNSIMEITRNHVLWSNKGWIAYTPEEVVEVDDAKKIEINDYLLNNHNKYIKIIDIQYIEYPEGLQCYDIKTAHQNFYASNYLMHNSACPC